MNVTAVFSQYMGLILLYRVCIILTIRGGKPSVPMVISEPKEDWLAFSVMQVSVIKTLRLLTLPEEPILLLHFLTRMHNISIPVFPVQLFGQKHSILNRAGSIMESCVPVMPGWVTM